MLALVPVLIIAAPLPAVFNGVPMEPVRDDVYVELPVTLADRQMLAAAVNVAYAQLHRAFAADQSFRAVVLICRTAACKVAFGAAPETARSADLGFASVHFPGVAEDRAVVVTGPNASTSRVLTHELVHAVMKSWAPYDALPTWFNEGLATAIADEPSCGGIAPSSSLDIMALTTKADWQEFVASSGATRWTYCQARYATEAWSSFAELPELGAKARALANGAAR